VAIGNRSSGPEVRASSNSEHMSSSHQTQDGRLRRSSAKIMPTILLRSPPPPCIGDVVRHIPHIGIIEIAHGLETAAVGRGRLRARSRLTA
jgi:hypothetical protein